MKKSNIIIIIAVILPLAWLLLSGWLQANAYKIIKSEKSCSYAEILGLDNANELHSFKNIKIDFETNATSPKLHIQYGKKQEISYANDFKKFIFYEVKEDTLYLKIKHVSYNSDNYVTICVPVLNSVMLLSGSGYNVGDDSGFHGITISGFNAKTLSVINDCQFNLRIENNKLKKLILKGQFYNCGKAEIVNYTEYDSLDVDIQGNCGKLIMGNIFYNKQPNPKQWIGIKVPETFRIEADASILLASKITIKK